MIFLIMTIMSLVCLGACASNRGGSLLPENGQENAVRADTGYVVIKSDSFDSADTCVLVDKNEDDNSVTFLNRQVGRRYTLTFDGTTQLTDKYGQAISLAQVEKGNIVDIRFLKSTKHLTSLQLSPQAWTLGEVTRFEINLIKNEISIGSAIYKLSENTQYLSDGKSIELMDLNACDQLRVEGIDNDVLSISIEKGHGYLRLTNDENFIGGWLEIGQQIQPITEDMLLTVPEGRYQVNISHNGGGGMKTASIVRGEECTLDIGDLEIPEPQSGMVLFSLTPTNADLYIDGTIADASLPVTLDYGLHQLIVRAEGYQSITQYLRVGQPSCGIDIVLEKTESENDGEKQESVSGSDLTTTGYYKMYFDAPEKAEVYLDGSYIGVAPCSVRKKSGTHTVTLRRTGYTTRSYTIQVDEEERDATFSFADLVPTSTGNSAGNSFYPDMNDIVNSIFGN